MDNFQNFRKFPQKIWKEQLQRSGICENFHFSFHYFIRVLIKSIPPPRIQWSRKHFLPFFSVIAGRASFFPLATTTAARATTTAAAFFTHFRIFHLHLFSWRSIRISSSSAQQPQQQHTDVLCCCPSSSTMDNTEPHNHTIMDYTVPQSKFCSRDRLHWPWKNASGRKLTEFAGTVQLSLSDERFWFFSAFLHIFPSTQAVRHVTVNCVVSLPLGRITNFLHSIRGGCLLY